MDVAKRVLVVDDMPYLRDIQVLLLSEAGYSATALGDAREALERLHELAPDLILLDLSMPEMDGRQFLARLRATPRWHGLPVILTTGKAVDGLARESGCDGMIASGEGGRDSAIVEVPLVEWAEMPGSKLAPGSMLRAGVELAGVAVALERFRRRSA